MSFMLSVNVSVGIVSVICANHAEGVLKYIVKFLNIFVEPENPDVGWDISVFPWCIFSTFGGFEGKAEELGFEGLDNILKYWNISSLLNISNIVFSPASVTYFFLFLKCVSLYSRISCFYHKSRTGTTLPRSCEVCHCLGDPVWGSVTSPAGLRGPGTAPAGWSPRRPCGGLLYQPDMGPIWMALQQGPSQAGDGLSPCYSCRSVHLVLLLFFFFIAAKPIAGQHSALCDWWRAVICWCCLGWSPCVSPCLASYFITHQPEPDFAQEELLLPPRPPPRPSFPVPSFLWKLIKPTDAVLPFTQSKYLILSAWAAEGISAGASLSGLLCIEVPVWLWATHLFLSSWFCSPLW